MRYFLSLFLPLWLFASEISIQVLGSGGPEIGGREYASYIVKKDNKELILIDFGGGTFLRFGQAKAGIDDLRVVLHSDLHIDQVVDIAALIKAVDFYQANRPLAIDGPDSNKYFPSIDE